MILKKVGRKSRVVTKVEQTRAPQEASDSEDEKFDKGFSFVDNAADYNFDTWKNLMQLVKEKKKVNLTATIKRVVSSEVVSKKSTSKDPCKSKILVFILTAHL